MKSLESVFMMCGQWIDFFFSLMYSLNLKDQILPSVMTIQPLSKHMR